MFGRIQSYCGEARMIEGTLHELMDYIEEQRGFERAADRYASGARYDFAIELVEGFLERIEQEDIDERA